MLFRSVRNLEPLLSAAIDASAKEDGWASLGGVGSLMTKIDPAFDARNYGYKKLSDLVRKLPYLEVKDVPAVRADGVANTNLHIRMKRSG